MVYYVSKKIQISGWLALLFASTRRARHKSSPNLAFLNSVCNSDGGEKVEGEGQMILQSKLIVSTGLKRKLFSLLWRGVGGWWEAGCFSSTLEISSIHYACIPQITKLITNYPDLFAEVLSRSQRTVYSVCCCVELEAWTKLLACLAGVSCQLLEKGFPVTTANRTHEAEL